MGLIVQKGSVVTIGSFAGGYPTLTTQGGVIPSPDRGISLRHFDPRPIDPLTVWKSQPGVRKVVGFIAREVAQLPWHIYQRSSDADRKRRSGSPAESLLNSPAPMVSGYSLWTALITDRLLYDVALAVLVEGELLRIPPGLIRITSDNLARPTGVYIETPVGYDDINVTDVPKVLMYGWHSYRAGGVSPMHTLAAILEENIRSVEWRTRQWTSDPKIAGIVKRPNDAKTWSPIRRQRFEEDMRGWRNGEGIPIFEDGMTYEQMNQLSPLDAKDIEGRVLSDIEVASAFHVPPELLGIRAGNFSNVAAFKEMLFGPTLGPLIAELQQAVNQGGVIRGVDTSKNLYAELNREAGLSGSFTEQARTFQTLTGRPVMTAAEARARLNLPYLEGTDELITPLNVIEGGQASPTDSGSQNIGGDNADPDAREDRT